MGRALNRIEVKGFKSIKRLDLELKALNVLIGANGVGKSNFIGVFKLLNQITEGNLQVYVGTAGGADTQLHFGKKTTNRVVLDLSFANNANGYNCILQPTADDRLIFAFEECWLHDQTRFQSPLRVPFGQRAW